MRALTLASSLLLALCCFAADDHKVVPIEKAPADSEKAPQVETMAPRVAKAGDTIVITGVSLGENKVDEIYFTDHKFDMRVKVLEQTDKMIKVRIPPFAKAGRMQLLLLTKPDKLEDPKLLEQPAYVLIEETSTQVGEVKTPEPVKTREQLKSQEQEQKK